jgi:hypothetical protein
MKYVVGIFMNFLTGIYRKNYYNFLLLFLTCDNGLRPENIITVISGKFFKSLQEFSPIIYDFSK